MTLAAFINAAWLAGALLFALKGKLSKEEKACLLLFFIIVNPNATGLFIDVYKLLGLTNEPAKEAAYEICRSFIVPAVLTLLINGLYSLSYKVVMFLAAVAVSSAIDYACLKSQILTFVHWNVMYSALYYAFLLLAGIGAMKAFRRWCM